LEDKKVVVGVIGCGYWGPNLIRNFSSLTNCKVKTVSDFKQGRLDFIKNEFPFLNVTNEFERIINDTEIEAVCIATPVTTHCDLAIKAMKAGKHVFIEKPMTSSVEEADKVLLTSIECNKKVAVGHVFQFSPAVRKIKELLDRGKIGKVFHITSTRINLGPPNTEVDVIWDLGPHDFSILLYLLGEYPNEVISQNSYFPFGFSEFDQNKLINNSHINLKFDSGISTHIHLSWLSSNKTRLINIYGSEGTIIYDEMLALDGKVKLYDKGIDNRIGAKDIESSKLVYKVGDIHLMQLEQHEPLRMECEHFINSILNNSKLINDGVIGKDVIKMLESASK
jgi:predicted dehydrogenase